MNIHESNLNFFLVLKVRLHWTISNSYLVATYLPLLGFFLTAAELLSLFTNYKSSAPIVIISQSKHTNGSRDQENWVVLQFSWSVVLILNFLVRSRRSDRKIVNRNPELLKSPWAVFADSPSDTMCGLSALPDSKEPNFRF